MKMKLVIVNVIVLMFSAGLVFAGVENDQGLYAETIHEMPVLSEVVNVGNKICPVSGEVIGGAMGEGVQVEHEGKSYNLCCAMCAKDFKKSPQEYIDKINEELAKHDEKK